MINLAGYNSTSQQREVAIGFAIRNQDPRKESVLMEINLKDGTTSGFCFVMDKSCFTRFPDEKEILLDDGLPFKITNVLPSNYKGIKFTIVQLESKTAA